MNKAILQSNLLKKFSDKIITSIVVESFYRGLPLDTDAKKDNINSIIDYCESILEAMGPSEMLANARQNNPDDKFLAQFANDVYDIASAAAKRCANEAVASVRSMDEIVDDSDFTPEELSKLKSKGIKLDAKEIGEIINKKVIDVIKAEKEDYEESEALKEKLSDSISALNNDDTNKEPALDDDNMDDDDLDPNIAEGTDTVSNAVDSYITLYMGPDVAKNPISLFSAIQSRAMESIINTNAIYIDELPMDTLQLLANETFDGNTEDLTKFEIIESKLKHLHTLKNGDYKVNDIDKELIENATVCAITFYTFLETLNTLKLHKPSKEELKNYIERKSSPDVEFKHAADEFNEYLKKYLHEIQLNYKSFDNSKIEEVLDQLDEIKDKAEDLNNDIEKVYPNTFEFLEKVEDLLKEELDERREGEKSDDGSDDDVDEENYSDIDPQTSYYDNIARESNIAEFNKIARYTSKPQVSSIIINAYNDKNPVVEFKGYAGENVSSYELNMKDTKLYSDKIEAVTEAALNSNIIYCNKELLIKIGNNVSNLIK